MLKIFLPLVHLWTTTWVLSVNRAFLSDGAPRVVKILSAAEETFIYQDIRKELKSINWQNVYLYSVLTAC